MLTYVSQKAKNNTVGLQGEISIPGDKSISHRSVIFASLAEGKSTVKGLLEGEDVLATVAAFKAMGVNVERKVNENNDYVYHFNGVGLNGLKVSDTPLNMGNSGTAMRLMAGLLVGQSFNSTLIGDRSLSKRPMGRIIKPLTQMGGQVEAKGAQDIQAPPLEISANNGQVKGGVFDLTVASAQVKSAILLAALYTNESVEIFEPDITRDHTERMFKGMGLDIEINKKHVKLNAVESISQRQFVGQVFVVPADFSSAMFFIVAALITANSQLTLKNIGINESRIGGLEILRQLGGRIELSNHHEVAGEPVADITVYASSLTGQEISPDLVALAIDEFPVIAIAAACASGKTIVTGAKELRVKESDRISAMVNGLVNVGIDASELPDGMIIEGGQIKGGVVESYDDHRIAMSFAVAGLVSEAPIVIHECDNVATSFPNFLELANVTGFDMSKQS